MANIKVRKTQPKNATDNRLDPAFVYCPTLFGVSKKHSGSGVKVAVVGTGLPAHRDLSNIGEFQTFVDKVKVPDDLHGNATFNAGVIAANGKHGLTGLAPKVDLVFTKGVNDAGMGTSSSIVASILWCVVKGVDIIAMPFGTQEDCPLLHEAIKKAYAANIALVAPAGKDQKDTEIDFPARYPEVVAVASSYKDDKFGVLRRENNEITLSFPKAEIPTLYGEDKIAYVSGSVVATGIVAGLLSLLIERDRGTKKLWTVKDSYASIYELHRG